MRLLIPFVLSLVSLLLPTTAKAQVINACANKQGALRIVGDLTECKTSETSLSWNVQGPQGPQGEQGPEGPPGSDAQVTARNILMSIRGCAGCFLEGEDLSGADLANTFLMGAKLRTTNFVGAGLSGANLEKADLTGADLTGANLDAAVFDAVSVVDNITLTNATARGVLFQGTDLTGEDFSTVDLSGAVFDSTFLTNTDFHGATMVGATLQRMEGSSEIRLNSTDFSGADLSNAVFLRVEASGGNPPSFVGTDLQGATFTRVTFPGGGARTDFSEADLRGASFIPFPGGGGETIFAAVVWEGADIAGATFDGTRFVESTTSALGIPVNGNLATWIGVFCPDGTQSQEVGDTCVGHFVPLP